MLVIVERMAGEEKADGLVLALELLGRRPRLDLRDAAFDFVTFNDVLNRANNTSAGVLIDLGAGDSVLLLGVTEAQLKAVDVLL